MDWQPSSMTQSMCKCTWQQSSVRSLRLLLLPSTEIAIYMKQNPVSASGCKRRLQCSLALAINDRAAIDFNRRTFVS